MSRLDDLKAASSLHSIACVLGYQPKGLAYVIYGISDIVKYKDFSIPKRSGGTRTISAPIPELKRLQKHLANLLENCVVDIDKARDIKNNLAHGFRPKHSIMTNAAAHRSRRYVFNVDLQDFFGTINFGRVWKYFEKNQAFNLNSDVARIIAQIACHNKALPQGSPCSPVISNLIGHLLDMRLVQLAARHGCHYSRYADDITFSTKRKEFPSSIAKQVAGTTQWLPAKSLIREIRRCGFEINPSKTRMQFKHFRQDVTGLIVNSKLNVRSEYSRSVRAMVHSYVTKGEFQVKRRIRDKKGGWVEKSAVGSEPQLRGMLSFIDSVRHFEQSKNLPKKEDESTSHAPRRDIKEMEGHARLYRRFLLYTQFFRPAQALLICEGKTDNVYIRCALRQMVAKHPALATPSKVGVDFKIDFFNYTNIADRILHLGGGTGDMCNFIAGYGADFESFKPEEKRNPVIIIIDNDSGAVPIFSTIKKTTKSKVDIDGSLPYYFIRDNLYIIPVPKISGKPTAIEDFFDKSVLATKLGGKDFSRSDKFNKATQYGKHLFAEHVVKKNQKTIDFSGFDTILQRIETVLVAHASKP